MAAGDFSFPDDSLDGSAVGLSGDNLSLDDFSGGSSLDLGTGVSNLGIYNLGSEGDLTDSINLSGASDSAPDPYSDFGASESGSGTAARAANPFSSFSPSTLANTSDKFGSFFQGLLSAPRTGATLAAPRPVSANPNVKIPSSITTSHALLAVGAVVILIAVISMSGSVRA
jgi:hypothetical protein